MPLDPHKVTMLGNVQIVPDGAGGELEGEGGTGKVFYVCNATSGLPEGGVTGSNNASGLSPQTPLSTIDYAIGLCTASRGDKIVVMPGHAETLTAAIALDVAGITIEGRGKGTLRPQITVNGAIDGISVTAANCKIENLYFNESTDSATSNINVAAANVSIEDCHFDLGATDLECITWASGANFLLKNNKFVVTANGPDAALEIEAANDGLIAIDNIFNGGSATNTFDAAAINSGQAHTNAYIDNNVFMYGIGLVVATSVSTVIGSGNQYVMGGTSNAAAPQVFFTDLGSTIRDGKSPEAPTTLDDALVTKATAGDIVYVLAGSTSSPTASQAMSVAGVSLIGLGNASNRPVITSAGTIDHIDMTGASCRIENIVFAAATATATSVINVGAADCIIKNCEFLAGASNTNAIITIPDAGDGVLIESNKFRVTANGPAIAISIEAAGCDRGVIKGNLFNGGSTTNQWDTAAINSGVAHTNYIISENTFLYGVAHAVASSVSTLISNNVYGVNATPSALTPITLYVDNGSTIRAGLSPATPTTLADALTKARTGAGDKVRLLPGTYTLAATATVDDAGISIGPYLDNGTANVVITTSADVDLFTVTGANVEIFGLRFLANAAQTTTPMMVSVATGDYGRIHHCWFDAASVASMIPIDIAAGATDWIVDNNKFVAGVASIGYVTSAGARTYIYENDFNCLDAASAAVDISTHATGGTIIRDNHIQGSGGNLSAMLILDTSAPVQFACFNNIFTGTTNATPFGQDTEYTTMFVNNYCPGATVAGGTLVDPVA